MKLEPFHLEVGKLFNGNFLFVIPKYQRGYSWKEESVNDFIDDIRKCVKNYNSVEKEHFFGGILSVREKMSGAIFQTKCEVVDGQQRLVTFTLLVLALIDKYKELEDSAGRGKSAKTNIAIIQDRISKLESRFISFEVEIQRKTQSFNVLTLSKTDDPFYRELIQDAAAVPAKNKSSNKKIEFAFRRLKEFISEITDSKKNLNAKLDTLEIVLYVIDFRSTVLHLITEDENDAYRLFQVINDRGVNLTEGDLLRAKTLELLEGFGVKQDIVENYWDEILLDEPEKTLKYLNWIYQSNKGEKAKNTDFYDLFLNLFFPQHESKITEKIADKIVTQVREILEQIKVCRLLEKGEWIYESSKIEDWDKNRLDLLITKLKHDGAIPLLLSAETLKEIDFSKIVQMLEKVFFRYIVICRERPESLLNIYLEEAIEIRKLKATYKTNSLQTKLKDLIEKKAKDDLFTNNLSQLSHQGSSGNSKLKYFLMTIDDVLPSWQANPKGNLKVDKSSAKYFDTTTIEHVYSKSASIKDPILEPQKNNLGNLLPLDRNLNDKCANKAFKDKKTYYKQSSFNLTKRAGNLINWSESELKKQMKLYTDIAKVIFNL